MCAWCLRWIAPDAPHITVPLVCDSLLPDQVFEELEIDGRPVLAIVPGPASPWARGVANVVVVTCGDECARALEQGLRDDAARARGETSPRREATERERCEAERLLRHVCAWCWKPIRRNAPVIGVYARLAGDRDRSALGGRMISLEIGGRLVASLLPEENSPAVLQGCDIGFLVCGDRCGRALTAAVALDQSLTIVH